MMNSIWGAYLEDYNKIKIIIPNTTKYNKLYLENELLTQELIINKIDEYANELHIYTSYLKDIKLNLDYYVIVNEDLKISLHLGKITRSKRFDEENYYDGPLGIEYHKEYTTFRIWSPVCKEVILILNDEKYPLKFIDKGLWEIEVEGDLDKLPYYYLIRVNDEYKKVIDPYGASVCANAHYNYVIDLNKTYQMNYDFVKFNSIDNTFIYEMNFRDLSDNVSEEDSLYLNAINKLEYIKNLNVSHIQLMPTYCFGGVNEKIKDSSNPSFIYNWGYNPVAYMVPSGWYASDADNPYSRINELKMFIDSAHKFGLGVNMDVVFNHVYIHETFSLGILVPGYVYRTDNSGFLMNSSYCGNDFRSEGLMNRRFIIDTIKLYQQFYKIDGFRFDLMGLIDNLTVLKIKEEVMKINSSSMLYGEGWYMNTTNKMDENANIGSAKKLYPVFFFNDYFRNIISGKMYDSSSFVTGNIIKPNVLKDILCGGSLSVMPFKNHLQSLNYIECHDNYTFYDKCKYLFKINEENKLVDYCKLGLGLVILSNGIKFIHSGQELMRSKKGNDNSYNLSDDINKIPWENISTKYDITSYLFNLITISKLINNKKSGRCFYNESHYEIRYEYDNYQVIIKNNYEEEDKYFVPGTTLIFNNESVVNINCESLSLNKPGIWVLKK